MSAADALVELELRTDEEAPAQVARVGPEALIEIVRATVSVGGSIWIRVTGKSMNPIIRHGDRVLITRWRGRARRGAVVLLDAAGAPLLHRVVSHGAGSVITKGDGRTMNDEPHPVTSILGHAVVVRREGVTICLAPTLTFGTAPLLRAVAWWFRTRVPEAWVARFRRIRTHAR
jgi:hypothetical protein